MEVIEIEMGQRVLCDFCGDDWSDSRQSGGLLFQSKATCPTCEPKIRKSAVEYGEEQFIRAVCPPDLSFAEWVRTLR